MGQNDTARERREIIVARVKSGETLVSIGQDLGISRERVRQLLRKHGYREPLLRKKAMNKAIREPAMPNPQFLTIPQAAKALGKSWGQMYRLVLRGEVIGQQDARGRWQVDAADVGRKQQEMAKVVQGAPQPELFSAIQRLVHAECFEFRGPENRSDVAKSYSAARKICDYLAPESYTQAAD